MTSHATRTKRLAATALVAGLVLAGCGSSSDGADGASEDTTTTTAVPGDTEITEAEAPAPQPGPTVEIPLTDQQSTETTPVDVGSPAVLGPMTVTVRSISAGDEPADEALNTIGSIDVDVEVENTGDERLTGPQFSTSCASGGAAALSIVGSEVPSLARMSGGEVLDGIAGVKLPAGCDEIELQVRVVPVSDSEGDYRAGYVVPVSALP